MKQINNDIEIGKLYRFTRNFMIRKLKTQIENYWEQLGVDETNNNFLCLDFIFTNSAGGKRIKILFLGEIFTMFIGDEIPPMCEELNN